MYARRNLVGLIFFLLGCQLTPALSKRISQFEKFLGSTSPPLSKWYSRSATTLTTPKSCLLGDHKYQLDYNKCIKIEQCGHKDSLFDMSHQA